MSKKLQNTGSRTFIVSNDKEFKPKATGTFSNEEAARLLKNYPNEIVDQDSLVEDFNSTDGESFTGLDGANEPEADGDEGEETLTVVKLRAWLDEKGVEYPSGTNKAGLLKLYEENQA